MFKYFIFFYWIWYQPSIPFTAIWLSPNIRSLWILLNLQSSKHRSKLKYQAWLFVFVPRFTERSKTTLLLSFKTTYPAPDGPGLNLLHPSKNAKYLTFDLMPILGLDFINLSESIKFNTSSQVLLMFSASIQFQTGFSAVPAIFRQLYYSLEIRLLQFQFRLAACFGKVLNVVQGQFLSLGRIIFPYFSLANQVDNQLFTNSMFVGQVGFSDTSLSQSSSTSCLFAILGFEEDGARF